MSAPLEITVMAQTATELRLIASKCRDGSQARRLLAIALVLEGCARTEAAARSGMDRQTLRDWVRRYNENGIDGLKSRHSSGRTAALTTIQMEELRTLVITGPDPLLHNVVRWRCLDLRAEVPRRFSVTVSEGTIGKWLRQLGLTRLQPRPFHPKKDADAQKAFEKLRRPLPACGGGNGGCYGDFGGGAAAKFLVVATPSKNMAHGLLRA